MILLTEKRIYPAHMRNRLTKKRQFKFIFLSTGTLVMVLVFTSIGMQSSTKNVLAKNFESYASALRFGGQNQKGQPYSVESKQGKEISKTEIQFDQVKADMTLKENNKVSVAAQQGVLNKDSKNMNLKGNVQLTHSNGLVLNTAEATVNLENGQAHNNAAIEGGNERAHIKAKGFRTESDTKIVFLGDPELTVRMR